jgi:hypothetical protein
MIMAVERIEDKDVPEIDLDAEIQTETYKISDLKVAGLPSVISQPAIVRYFERQNPELVVKQVYSFMINQQDQTIILKVRITKRLKIDATKLMLPGEPLDMKNEPSTAEPITNPARLLNAGDDTPEYSEAHVEEVRAAELASFVARVEELEAESQEYWVLVLKHKELKKENRDLQSYKKAYIAFQECPHCVENIELKKENATLKSAIEKFGNGQDFDWNVLGRIDELETAVVCAIANLPERPDSARAYLVHVVPQTGEQKAEGENNG